MNLSKILINASPCPWRRFWTDVYNGIVEEAPHAVVMPREPAWRRVRFLLMCERPAEADQSRADEWKPASRAVGGPAVAMPTCRRDALGQSCAHVHPHRLMRHDLPLTALSDGRI